MPPIFSSKRIAPIGRSMPKFVPMPSSPGKRAFFVGVERRLQVVVAALGLGRHQAALAELQRHVLDDQRRAARSGSVKRITPSADVLVRAGEDLARRHVALAVGVDPGAAVDRQPQVGPRAWMWISRLGVSRSIKDAWNARSSPQSGRGIVAVEEQRAGDEVGELARAHAGLLGRGGGRVQRDRPAAGEHQLGAAGPAPGPARGARGVHARQRVRVLGRLDAAATRRSARLPRARRDGTPSRCRSRAACQSPRPGRAATPG